MGGDGYPESVKLAIKVCEVWWTGNGDIGLFLQLLYINSPC